MQKPKSTKYSFGRIITSPITALTFKQTIDELEKWVLAQQKRYVCICNTHSVVTASNDSLFETALTNADICTPDGMPLVWALRSYGFVDQDRVDGPNLMLKLCELSSAKRYRVFLYGGTDETLQQLVQRLSNLFPSLEIAGSYSPPFRSLTDSEDAQIVDMINSAKADFIFVGLGCPKQEIWMYRHRDNINGVMIGVGAAFDFITGNKKRCPEFMQRIGMEWLFRLMSEPGRLWKRYAYNNPVYIYRFIKTYKKNKKHTLTNNNLLQGGMEG